MCRHFGQIRHQRDDILERKLEREYYPLVDAMKASGSTPGRVASSGRVKKGEDKSTSMVIEVAGETLLMLCLADGHGGGDASAMCQEFALGFVAEEAATGESSGEALQAACARAFRRLHTYAIESFPSAGTTLTIAIVNDERRELTCANVGDSSAILVEEGAHTLISTDHRLEVCEEERQRILEQGGILAQAQMESGAPGGPLRAWPGGLAVARTIGDADCLQNVSADPSLRTLPMPTTGVVVLSSDGVWDALPQEKVASAIRKASSVEKAAESVIAKAIQARGLRDDTTCIMATIGEFYPEPSPQAARRMSRFSSPMRRLRSASNDDAADYVAAELAAQTANWDISSSPTLNGSGTSLPLDALLDDEDEIATGVSGKPIRPDSTSSSNASVKAKRRAKPKGSSKKASRDPSPKLPSRQGREATAKAIKNKAALTV